MFFYDQTRCLPYGIEDVFSLVADVEKYPEFVPWCRKIVVRQKTPQALMVALTAGRGLWQKTYTSQVLLTPWSQIQVFQHQGPLKRLWTLWTFQSLGTHKTQVRFRLEMTVGSSVLSKFLDPFLKDLPHEVMRAFEERAHKVCEK